MELAKEKIVFYEQFLQEISREVDASVSRRINDILKPSSSLNTNKRRSSSASSSSSIGSLDGVDVVEEDVNQSEESRATGYIGKSSEVAWMQRLDLETRRQGGTEPFSGDYRQYQDPTKAPIFSLNYHLDSADISNLGTSNPYVLPPKALAYQLICIYLESVHPSFPIIRQDLFTDQVRRLYLAGSINPGKKWLAVFNLVLAIGRKHCDLIGQGTQEDGDVFFARAQSLNISESVLNDYEDLQQVQIETLAAFFLLASARINRAWKMIGTATRSSIALGLHLQVAHAKFDVESLGSRRRLWWSIFLLEHLLSMMTGRVSCIGNSSSAPPPRPSEGLECVPSGFGEFGESSHERLVINSSIQWTIFLQQPETQHETLRSMAPNHSLYFFCLIDLIFISHTAINHIYNNVHDETKHVRRRIGLYNTKMDQWCSGLPNSMRFQELNDNRARSNMNPYQASLSLHYYSARIVLNRPCFSLPKSNEKTGIRSFRSHLERDSALICLRSSLAMISLLPDHPDADWAYRIAPWWTFLHFLVQSTTILLLHVSVEDFKICQTGEGSAKYTDLLAGVIAASGKAMNWLLCLKGTDEAAKRAFELLKDCIERIKVQKGSNVSDFYANHTFETTTTTPRAQSNVSGGLDDRASHQDHDSIGSTSQIDDAQVEGSGDDALFRGPELAEAALDNSQYPFGVLGDDVDMIDMSCHISHPTDPMFDELLLSLGVPTS
ncbi:hypothetical protein N7460_003034 [Penicillium canescens]|uniref:Xylanolytic transcriptional activator regulatory domain-containing protein n=1 Tax=Penicillium canescens TaxID=5083 RepID=A0AAD6NCU1_PENCN|nr:hypothetical protein N7460_003034 [Penicillium canescens]